MNRLRPPAPVDPWNLQNPNTVLHTTRKSPACIQPEKVVQSEDCLYINVFTPSIDRVSGPMPVLVWFHGGAFLFGNSLNPKLTDPSYWIQHKDLVLVAFSYRVGALGFLTTDQIPANLGMMDQVAALQWVQSNIHL
jgi:carboxylesterase type B